MTMRQELACWNLHLAHGSNVYVLLYSKLTKVTLLTTRALLMVCVSTPRMPRVTGQTAFGSLLATMSARLMRAGLDGTDQTWLRKEGWEQIKGYNLFNTFYYTDIWDAEVHQG